MIKNLVFSELYNKNKARNIIDPNIKKKVSLVRKSNIILFFL